MTVIIPMLYTQNVGGAIQFYEKAFGARERWRIDHDGRVHVAEMILEDVLFRLHDEVASGGTVDPTTVKATTVVIDLLVDDPDALAKKAVAAGATELSPVQDHDYGYRQGTIRDPYGHHWTLEKFVDLRRKPTIAK